MYSNLSETLGSPAVGKPVYLCLTWVPNFSSTVIFINMAMYV